MKYIKCVYASNIAGGRKRIFDYPSNEVKPLEGDFLMVESGYNGLFMVKVKEVVEYEKPLKELKDKEYCNLVGDYDYSNNYHIIANLSSGTQDISYILSLYNTIQLLRKALRTAQEKAKITIDKIEYDTVLKSLSLVNALPEDIMIEIRKNTFEINDLTASLKEYEEELYGES